MSEYLVLARKAVYDRIQKMKLDPSDFLLSEEGQVLTLQFKDSPLKFTFKKNAGSHDQFRYRYDTFVPHKGIITNYATHIKPVTFKRCLTVFTDKFLKEQIKSFIEEKNAVDPWISLKSKNNLFEALNNEDETPFTPIEKKQIVTTINQFEKLVTEKFNLVGAQLQHVQKELNYLRESTDRLNKRDWKAVAKNIIYDIGVNIIGNLALQIPAAFWIIVKEAFRIIPFQALP
jgi:hypothetical protein